MRERLFTGRRIATFAIRLARTRRATSSVEYGFILGVIVLVLFIGLVQMADVTQKMWSDITARVTIASKSP